MDEKKPIDYTTRSFGPGSYTEEKDGNGNVVQRKCRATFATDGMVEVYDWVEDELIREVLCMEGMELPANRQLPLLDNHSRYNGSASVKGSCRNITVENDHAEADCYFSSLSNDIATLAREGHLTDLSVGYKTSPDKTKWLAPGERATVNGKEYVNDSKLRCALRTWWKPFEVSTTPIGADARTKFRSKNNDNKPKERGSEMDQDNGRTATVQMTEAEKETIRNAAAKEAREAEAARRNEIETSCRELGIEPDFVKDDLAKYTPAAEVTRKLIVEAQKRLKVAPPQAPNLGVNADETDKFRETISTCLALRNGVEEKRLEKKNVEMAAGSEFRNIDGPQKLARLILARSGRKDVAYMDNHQVAQEILGGRAATAQSTGDFPYILAAAINKFLMKGYDEVPTTYQIWTGKQPLNDFKQNKLVNLSNYSDIAWIPEGANPEWGRFSDKAEYATLYKYGKAYNLSYEAIVNDDKNAFSRIPAAMAGAVARKKDRCTYNLLYRGNTEGTGSGVVGPTMNEDSLAMFYSTHANLGTTAAPSTASLAEARALLSKIKLLAPDPTSKSQYTGASIKYILAPEAKWSEWHKVLGSPAAYLAADGSTANANPAIVNPFASMGIQLITSPYIDEYSTTVWYAVADPNVAQHIVVCTLAGEEAPQIRSQPSEIGMARGIVWDIMSIFTVAASDWRGIVKNAGA